MEGMKGRVEMVWYMQKLDGGKNAEGRESKNLNKNGKG